MKTMSTVNVHEESKTHIYRLCWNVTISGGYVRFFTLCKVLTEYKGTTIERVDLWPVANCEYWIINTYNNVENN